VVDSLAMVVVKLCATYEVGSNTVTTARSEEGYEKFAMELPLGK
jgi:hypothetical protein